MDWIHCNICFTQPSKESPSFLLSSCGHMYCSTCLGNGGENGSCRVCGTECNLIELVADMRSEVREFFVEPEEILSKLTSVLNFQKQHRKKLTAHWISLNRKYNEAKSEIKRLHHVIQKVYGNMKIMYKENNELKSTLLSAGKSSPLSRPAVPIHCSSARPQKSNMSQNEPTNQFIKSNLLTPLRISKQRNPINNSGNIKYPINSACSSHHRLYGSASTFMTPPSDTPDSK